MSSIPLPITENDISKSIGRTIKSPILIADLDYLGMDSKAFIDKFARFSSELPWDFYDVRRLQVAFLIQAFPKDKTILESRLPDYFTGKKDIRTYHNWINRLSDKQRSLFEDIQPWRRRTVAKFILSETKSGLAIKRTAVPQYTQEVTPGDIRSLPRIFEEAPAAHVENEAFFILLEKLFSIVKKVRAGVGQKVSKVSMTAHFMSVKATSTQAGDNSPEGAHEDGADYIVSALVYHRSNIKGGQTQIIEKLPDGKKEIIFRHILQPGQFVFQADTRDELTYGTDLWHHVTPFYIANPEIDEAWRDIIGLDINVKK